MGLTIKVDPGEKVRLAKTDTDRAAGLTKSAGNARLAALSEQLGELQELLFAAQRHAVLIVLQGMDTSGKDGTIKHVMSTSIRWAAAWKPSRSRPKRSWRTTSSGGCTRSRRRAA
jgi:polyphosphate kinase 2 (PPK2 family)